MRKLDALPVIAIFLVIPALVWFAQTNLETWNARLLYADLDPEPNRHTPIFSEGTFLPPKISTSRTFTTKDNPIILTDTTTINKDVTITFEPNTQIVVHEFGQLIVAGQLHTNQATFTTNEKNTNNQTWNGIHVTPEGKASIAKSTIQFSSPALTCEAGARANITQSQIGPGSMGLYTESTTCTVDQATIFHGVKDHVVSL